MRPEIDACAKETVRHWNSLTLTSWTLKRTCVNSERISATRSNCEKRRQFRAHEYATVFHLPVHCSIIAIRVARRIIKSYPRVIISHKGNVMEITNCVDTFGISSEFVIWQRFQKWRVFVARRKLRVRGRRCYLLNGNFRLERDCFVPFFRADTH